jgi:hypothetical protein
MVRWARKVVNLLQILPAVLFIMGCRAPHTAPAENAAERIDLRNNAASLLYDLLGDEQNVSKLLIIKRDREQLHRVIKSIASSADANRKALEQLMKQDPSLDLKATALPRGERAARAAESETKRKELLAATGTEFEFKLLLTQAEALAYGAHLAKVAAQSEAQPERAKAFTAVSTEMQRLHGNVIALLRSSSTR